MSYTYVKWNAEMDQLKYLTKKQCISNFVVENVQQTPVEGVFIFGGKGKNQNLAGWENLVITVNFFFKIIN